METRMIFLSLVLVLIGSNLVHIGFAHGRIADSSKVVLAMDSKSGQNDRTFSRLRPDSKAKDQRRSKRAIRFELHPHFVAEEGGSYKEGGPVSLRCTFVNTSSRPQKILLSDHNDYSGTLPYPHGLAARVWDSSGELITKNEYSQEGWWSWSYYSSAIFFERPGDRITLPPQEKVIRIVPLDVLLQGCKTLPEGLKPGRYSVQLMLDNMVSNKVEIMIRGK